MGGSPRKPRDMGTGSLRSGFGWRNRCFAVLRIPFCRSTDHYHRSTVTVPFPWWKALIRIRLARLSLPPTFVEANRHPRMLNPEQPRYRCSLCGPSSLHGDRTERDCECKASRKGFAAKDKHLYASCGRCSSRMSVECLEAISLEVEGCGFEPHDPEGVWRTLVARPWRSNRQAHPCLQGWCANRGEFKACLLCESGPLPTAQHEPGLDEIKKARCGLRPDGSSSGECRACLCGWARRSSYGAHRQCCPSPSSCHPQRRRAFLQARGWLA